jgi:hypothetical protein
MPAGATQSTVTSAAYVVAIVNSTTPAMTASGSRAGSWLLWRLRHGQGDLGGLGAAITTTTRNPSGLTLVGVLFVL